MTNVEAQREQMYAELEELKAYGFWQIQGDMEPEEPRVKEKAHVWRFEDFKPHILRAGEIVPHELADRRGIILRNPGYDMSRPYTTNTLFVAYSVYMPGEIFGAHIHAPAASRLVLQCDGKGYTTVAGEKCYLERGDLVITPSGTWHDHGNEGDAPMIWVDMLDIPIPILFNAGKFGWQYRENGVPVESQSELRSQQYSKRHYGFGGLRPRFAQTSIGNDTSSPQLHWKYADVRAALIAVRNEAGDPYDGIILDYVDVTNGGPIQKTQNFSMQMLRPGEHTLAHRHTNSAVYVCIEGSGHTIINGEKHSWTENDVFCVPSVHWHEHVNDSKSEDAVLYSVTDEPALEKLGLLWGEQKRQNGEIVGKGYLIPA
jgi:gentisate 1,2-dioxygenase